MLCTLHCKVGATHAEKTCRNEGIAVWRSVWYAQLSFTTKDQHVGFHRIDANNDLAFVCSHLCHGHADPRGCLAIKMSLITCSIKNENNLFFVFHLLKKGNVGILRCHARPYNAHTTPMQRPFNAHIEHMQGLQNAHTTPILRPYNAHTTLMCVVCAQCECWHVLAHNLPVHQTWALPRALKKSLLLFSIFIIIICYSWWYWKYYFPWCLICETK